MANQTPATSVVESVSIKQKSNSIFPNRNQFQQPVVKQQKVLMKTMGTNTDFIVEIKEKPVFEKLDSLQLLMMNDNMKTLTVIDAESGLGDVQMYFQDLLNNILSLDESVDKVVMEVSKMLQDNIEKVQVVEFLLRMFVTLSNVSKRFAIQLLQNSCIFN